MPDDPVLVGLVKEAIANRPELKQVKARIAAERERIPQSKVMPDPTLSMGIQNDGFGGIQIGKMETSYVSIMASQTFPWSGKRALRGDLAGLASRDAELDLKRALLSIAADVERAYLDLLLVRDQLRLLGKLEALWAQSESLARFRYEAGESPQSDLLRAQLQRSRLRQKRFALESDERRQILVLNRLRGHIFEEAIPAERSLADLPDPEAIDPGKALVADEKESPELQKSLLVEEQADRSVALANKDRFPDVTVSAGVMPRGGNFETMWTAGVSMNLPIWGSQKQHRAIAEFRARGDAARDGAEVIRRLLRQRVNERREALGAILATNQLYREGLLVQSEATVASTLAQYQVGRVSFASVLEALAGHLDDQDSYLQSIAAAQKIAIAEQEISLESPGGPAAGGMGKSPMPGAGATPGSASAVKSSSGTAQGDDTASMTRM